MDKPILTLANVLGATASGNVAETHSMAGLEDLAAELRATEDVAGTSLDVVIQDSFDEGVTWQDWVTFTQLTTDGNEVKDAQAPTTRPPGGRVRVSYTIVGGTWSFTVKLAVNVKQ